MKWYAKARYEDGFEVEKEFPYAENGDYARENEKQYAIEERLLNLHEGCVYYSVGVADD